MKSSKLLLVTLLTTPLLTQCLVVDETGNTPASNVSGSPQKSQHVYDKGVNMGRNDGRKGLSRNPGRHTGQYAAAESDAFNMGYEKGYNQGIR
jgi:hypothetical protein